MRPQSVGMVPLRVPVRHSPALRLEALGVSVLASKQSRPRVSRPAARSDRWGYRRSRTDRHNFSCRPLRESVAPSNFISNETNPHAMILVDAFEELAHLVFHEIILEVREHVAEFVRHTIPEQLNIIPGLLQK